MPGSGESPKPACGAGALKGEVAAAGSTAAASGAALGTASGFELQVSSDPANLARVRLAVEKFAAEQGLDANAQGDIGLCVNEAMANVTRHAYHGAADRPIRITASKEGDAFVLNVRDWGDGRLPPAEYVHDPLKPGGLGLHCLRMLMSDIQYFPQPDGMLLTMKRKLS